jgi:hypothetical protein
MKNNQGPRLQGWIIRWGLIQGKPTSYLTQSITVFARTASDAFDIVYPLLDSKKTIANDFIKKDYVWVYQLSPIEVIIIFPWRPYDAPEKYDSYIGSMVYINSWHTDNEIFDKSITGLFREGKITSMWNIGLKGMDPSRNSFLWFMHEYKILKDKSFWNVLKTLFLTLYKLSTLKEIPLNQFLGEE